MTQNNSPAKENVKRLPSRSEVPAELKWDVASVFASDEAWEQALAQASQMPERAAAFAGRLSESPERKCFRDLRRQEVFHHGSRWQKPFR